MTIEIRLTSQHLYEHKDSFGLESYSSATGWISLRQSNSPIRTLELDEGSFFLAYENFDSFLEYALGAYATNNKDVVATIYQYSTISTNFSHRKLHQENHAYMATFFGVIGKRVQEILDTIKLALISQINVPDRIVQDTLKDASKRRQIYCDYSPDSIRFDENRGVPSHHIEDGRVWRPYGADAWDTDTWYTDRRWRRARARE